MTIHPLYLENLHLVFRLVALSFVKFLPRILMETVFGYSLVAPSPSFFFNSFFSKALIVVFLLVLLGFRLLLVVHSILQNSLKFVLGLFCWELVFLLLPGLLSSELPW